MGRRYLLFHRERYPEIRSHSNSRAEKFFRSDADDCVRRIVDRDRLADRRGIATETFLPPRVTDNRDRMTARILIVTFVQYATETGINSQHREIRARDELDLHLLDVAGSSVCIDETVHVPGNTQNTPHTRKQIGALLDLAIKRIREEVPAFIRKAVGSALVLAVTEKDQLIGFFHRQGLEQHRIQQTEDGRVRSDSQR